VLHSNSSLCNLVKTLDSRLEKEAKWNHFFEYQTLSSCVGIASVSSEILPAIDYILLEYLIPQILSTEHIEMAQYLYFDATLVNLTVIGLDDENENIGDRFTEDVYNVKQILLKSMISKVDQINIKETWQITDKQPGNRQRKHFVIVLDSISYMCTYASEAQQDQKAPLISQPFTVPCSIAISNQSAAAKRSKFGEIWEPKDSDDSEDSEKENNSAIENLAITKHRGRPVIKRFKAATEKPCCQLYTCRGC
ncbi:38589_t:CDS:2, partial [Gigaspora margarita]